MRIKRYVAEDMVKAMALIKQDMGNDAIILSTKTVKKGGFLGFFSRKMIEVTAASDLNNEYLTNADNTKIYDKKGKKNDGIEELKQEMYEIKKMISNFSNPLDSVNCNKSFNLNTKALNRVYSSLINNGVQQKIAVELIEKTVENLKGSEIKDEDMVKEAIKKEIANRIKENFFRTKNNSDKRTIAFIGPTGVGKTTSIAKLAARYSLYKNKKVGLITTDTYRVAAVEQLKTYSEIMGIPLQVVYTPYEMEESFLTYKDLDIILIDTAGMSSRNKMHLKELKNMLEAVPLTDTFLVLSATTKEKDLIEIISNYSLIETNRLMFTKLDETSTYGCLLNAVCYTDNALSYVTTGQSVPEDIEEVNPDRLASLILGECEW